MNTLLYRTEYNPVIICRFLCCAEIKSIIVELFIVVMDHQS